MKVALVSPRGFCDRKNGWHKGSKKSRRNSIFLLHQDDEVLSLLRNVPADIRDLFRQLEPQLKKIDRVYLYVGKDPDVVKRTIDLVVAKLDPAKTTLLFCRCSDEDILWTLGSRDFQPHQILITECGGRDTMENMLNELLGCAP